jgi:transcriptional regulator with XRE-family HTH domain
MEDNVSPLLLRRRLRTELVTARLKKGFTQQHVAEAMEWSLSKMNRIEQAKTGISANDLRALLRLYEITDQDQAEELVAMAREARRTPWWRERYGDVAPSGLLDLIDYESAASAVNQFENMWVPGILQTEEYASAALRVFHDKKSAEKRLSDLVDLRTERRQLLKGDNAPIFSFILDEAVLSRLIVSPPVTRQQFMHLASVADLPNVTIQVVPFAAGPYRGMKGPFEVVQFMDAPDEKIVFLEGPRGDIISDEPKETEAYLSYFKRFADLALGPSESVRLLTRIAKEIT